MATPNTFTSSSTRSASTASTTVLTPAASEDGSVGVLEQDVPIPSIEIDSTLQNSLPMPGSHGGRNYRSPGAANLPTESEHSSPPHGVASNITPSPSTSTEADGVGHALEALRLSSSAASHSNASYPTIEELLPRPAAIAAQESSALNLHDLSSALHEAAINDRPPRSAVSTPPPPTRGGNLSPSPETFRQSLSPSTFPQHSSRRRSRSSAQAPLPRHETRDEAPPESRFDAAGLQQALADSQRVVAGMKSVLTTSSLHAEPDSALRGLFTTSETLSRFEGPRQRTVGLVGDSGAGKSSLINSLLDIKDLAHANSSSGGAITCVVTEYRFKRGDDFSIEVDYFSREAKMEQLSELLGAYRSFHSSSRAPSAEDRSLVPEEKADLALHTFKSMFRDRLADAGDFDFILRDDLNSVLARFEEWIEQRHQLQGTVEETFSDIEECSRRLQKLTCESESNTSQEPADWPWIEKIRVYCNAYILSKDLILVDLPGLRDMNTARRKITETYMRGVDEIFAVCRIDRATTDAGLLAVFDLARRARLQNISIICTKSDDIQAHEALRDWNAPRAATVQRWMDAIATEERFIANFQLQIDEFGDTSDMLEEEMAEYVQLVAQSNRAKKREVQHQFHLQQFLINTRNDIVARQLRRNPAYNVQPGGSSLVVFCVSNLIYRENRDKPRDESLPHLQLSGILAVRQHCVGVVAEARYRAALLYIQHKVPALLDNVRLWVEAGSGSLSAERKLAIRSAVESAERELKKGLTARDSQLASFPTRTLFDRNITQRQEADDWIRAATTAARSWNGLHHSTYSAFCRKFGVHTTGAGVSRHWNEEAIEEMVDDMRPSWRQLENGIQAWIRQLSTAIDNTFAIASAIVENAVEESEQLSSLASTFTHHQRILRDELDGLFGVQSSQLRNLETIAYSGTPTSLIAEALHSSYLRCQEEYGTGSDRRRKDIMTSKLRDRDLFPSMYRELWRKYYAVTKCCEEAAQESAQRHLREIMYSINIVKDDNVTLESEREPEFRQRMAAELQRATGELERIQAAVAE